MRTFIAIPLPAQIKKRLSDLQDQLRASGAEVKWVEPQNIHLTLKFLGERDEKKIEKIMAVLDDTVKGKLRFSIRISQLGAFPRIDSPRVIWVGISQGEEETKIIAQELEEKIARLGIPKEDRPFSSHITLGRTRSAKNLENLVRELNNAGVNWKTEGLEFTVNQITLFKSTLTSRGPTYETLKEAALKTI